MSLTTTSKITLTTGLALFAMFFGAGNIVYPLTLGSEAGSHLWYVLFAFLISGIGLPFLGLFSASLYSGNYWDFYSHLGKVTSFILISFLVLFIGPLFAIPRTEAVTFGTLGPLLPHAISNRYLFSIVYCVLVFLLTYRQTKVVDIIGKYLSPVKILFFTILIMIGLMSTHHLLPSSYTAVSALKLGFINGYGTMDLLATSFFCAVVFHSLFWKAKANNIHCTLAVNKIFLKSCGIGAVLLGLVYSGFMIIAHDHAASLQGVEPSQMIGAISTVLLGQWGAVFISACVLFACLATATALTEVATNFFYQKIFKEKVNRMYCLVGSLVVSFFMSILGFSGIMKIAMPILTVLYPALIIYSIVAMVLKLRELSKNKLTATSVNNSSAMVTTEIAS